jgi:hypothetical protein
MQNMVIIPPVDCTKEVITPSVDCDAEHGHYTTSRLHMIPDATFGPHCCRVIGSKSHMVGTNLFTLVYLALLDVYILI